MEDLIGEGDPQIYALSGANSRSSLKIIKQGLPVKEIGAIPIQKTQNVWTLKTNPNDKFHSYIFLSTISSTTSLQVNEAGKVSDLKMGGIKYDVPSLHFGAFYDGSILQVFNTGFKHIAKNKNAKEFTLSGQIMKATNNQRQLALCLRGGDLMYYEINNSGDL